MDNMYLVLAVLLVGLIVFAGVQAVQLADIKAQITGGATSSGETYEQMMARMHPDQVKTQATKSVQTQSAMVGGC